MHDVCMYMYGVDEDTTYHTQGPHVCMYVHGEEGIPDGEVNSKRKRRTVHTVIKLEHPVV